MPFFSHRKYSFSMRCLYSAMSLASTLTIACRLRLPEYTIAATGRFMAFTFAANSFTSISSDSTRPYLKLVTWSLPTPSPSTGLILIHAPDSSWVVPTADSMPLSRFPITCSAVIQYVPRPDGFILPGCLSSSM